MKPLAIDREATEKFPFLHGAVRTFLATRPDSASAANPMQLGRAGHVSNRASTSFGSTAVVTGANSSSDGVPSQRMAHGKDSSTS